MKTNYIVDITAFAKVLVIAAENEEKAIEYAENVVRFGDFEMDMVTIRREVKDEELDYVKGRVNAVSEDE